MVCLAFVLVFRRSATHVSAVSLISTLLGVFIVGPALLATLTTDGLGR